jgi:hypothetical protein
MHKNDAETPAARMLNASNSAGAPVYIQERTYFDIIAKTLEAVGKMQSPRHSMSQVEKALGGKFEVSRYSGFESKGFIIDDES